MNNQLHFMCGKMASGKSTLAKKIAKKYDAILLSEDDILSKLYPNEIKTITEYLKYSKRVKEILTEHIIDLLAKGTNVVLDFPGNTKEQRKWFRDIFQKAWVKHTLHFVDKNDDVCKSQLAKRNESLPKGAPFTTKKEFDMITKYFEKPEKAEKFNIIRYE